MEQQFVSSFQATLEPDATIIRNAEERIRELHSHPKAGVALLNVIFTHDNELPLPIRQAAAVNLSKWIKERWSPFFAEFIGFTASQGEPNNALHVEDKQPIRFALLNALSLQESKIRGPLLKALINIASCDWPDEFPDLLPAVRLALQTQQSGMRTVEGALSFLDEWFYTSMDETSLLSITRELFPDLESILSTTSSSAQVRCHCVSILNQTLETLWMVKEEYPDAAKTVAQEFLPRWLSILETIVEQNPESLISSLGHSSFSVEAGERLALQAQAWQTLGTATHFSSHFKPHLANLRARAFAALSALQRPFEIYHLTGEYNSEPAGADGVAFFATPSALAAKAIDFLGVILYKSRTDLNEHVVSIFVPLLSSFSRITATEEEEWLENVSSFVTASEDEEIGGALNASMRGRCADILAELTSKFPREALLAMSEVAIETHANAQRHVAGQGGPGWWKDEEAVLALLGGMAELVKDENEKAVADQGSPLIDLFSLFSTAVLPYMSGNTPHFLYGRCFVFASQFASSLPSETALQFLQAAVQVIDSEGQDDEGMLIVKLSAVRCIKNFHRHLDAGIVQPYAARILSRLAPLLSNANDDVLVLIIETLQAVAAQSTGDQITIPAHLYGEMASAAIQAWSREARDRVLQVAVEDLLDAFARQDRVDAAICTFEGALPTIAYLLRSEITATTNGGGGVMREACVEFVSAISKTASKEVLVQVQTSLVQQVFPVFFVMLSAGTDDWEVNNAAARLLSILIDKIPEACLSWSDGSGRKAIDHILRLVSRMISPDDLSESGGLAVGELLITLLRKRPETVAEQLPTICRALLTRLASAKSTSLIQSLILPLAFLMKDHLSTVVNLVLDHRIEHVEGHAQMALQVLMRKWLEYASSVQGFWNARISTLGLCAVFEARSTLPDLAQQIDRLLVDGDLIPDNSNIIKTRSRAKQMPDKYTQIPVPAKIIKVIIAELRQATDGPPKRSSGGQGDAIDALTDDEDDDWDDDEFDVSQASKSKSAFLSDMLGEDLDGDLEDLLHESDEDQFKDDEIWNMNFRSYLQQFFRKLVGDPNLKGALSPYLSKEEVSALNAAVN